MQTLNPTLWRTCRVLAGETRLKFFRQLLMSPGQCVTGMARQVGVGVSDASQELRRLQSRGLLQAERSGLHVFYRLGADPQVPSAAPLLNALRASFSYPSWSDDNQMIRITTALSHPRRISLARLLARHPLSIPDMQRDLGWSRSVLDYHLNLLADGGFIHSQDSKLTFKPPAHPLGQALADLVKE